MTIGRFLDFCKNMRALDGKEVEQMMNVPFTDLELKDFAKAEVCYEEKTNKVFAIGGVDKFNEKWYVWMLCTKRVEQKPITFLRFMKAYLKERLEVHPVLVNYAWVENALHLRWLKWMGAKFEDTYKAKQTGTSFIYFELRKE